MKHFTLTLSIAATALLTLPTLSLAADEKKPERKRPEGAGGGRMNPEERLKKMTEQLTLTEEQQGKIKAILEGGRAEMAKLKDTPEDQRRAKFGEFMKAQNEKILAVLTPEQQEKYKTAQAERAKQAGARGDRKPGDRKPGEGDKKPAEGGAKPEAK
jgi:Spy/CpxP family protein refolding chaperone